MQWKTLFKKEMVESWRNKKWIWFPLVIILLAIMDPITNYYLPQIIDSVGGMPEGTTFELPEFLPADVIIMSLGQISSLGVLIIVIMSMGTIASERRKGVAELILVKPVSYKSYITAKWAAITILVLTSFLIGMIVSWYYTNLLYGELGFGTLLLVVLFYSCWLIFVVSLTIFYNTVFKSSGLIAFLTIITIMIMSLLNQIFRNVVDWIPNNITNQIYEMVITESISSGLVWASITALILAFILLISSFYVFRTKEIAN